MALKMKDSSKETAKPGEVDYTKHLVGKPVIGTVSVQEKANKQIVKESSKQEVVHPYVVVPLNGYSINVSGGRTINKGNMEFTRVDVGIIVPCAKDSVNEAYEWASDWVSNKIEEAEKAVKS